MSARDRTTKRRARVNWSYACVSCLLVPNKMICYRYSVPKAWRPGLEFPKVSKTNGARQHLPLRWVKRRCAPFLLYYEHQLRIRVLIRARASIGKSKVQPRITLVRRRVEITLLLLHNTLSQHRSWEYMRSRCTSGVMAFQTRSRRRLIVR